MFPATDSFSRVRARLVFFLHLSVLNISVFKFLGKIFWFFEKNEAELLAVKRIPRYRYFYQTGITE